MECCCSHTHCKSYCYRVDALPARSQKARSLSLSDKRFLYDAQGQPVVGMARKMLAMKQTW